MYKQLDLEVISKSCEDSQIASNFQVIVRNDPKIIKMLMFEHYNLVQPMK
jgi:hypothetical protein